MPEYMVVLAILIVAVLMAVAAYYHVRLFMRSKELSENEEALKQQVAERKQRNANSIVIISRAVLDDQVTLTEASIRITALAPTLGLDDDILEQLSVFQQLAEATSHIPILDKWKALSKKEKANYTKERESIEAKFEGFVKDAARKITSESIVLK